MRGAVFGVTHAFALPAAVGATAQMRTLHVMAWAQTRTHAAPLLLKEETAECHLCVLVCLSASAETAELAALPVRPYYAHNACKMRRLAVMDYCTLDKTRSCSVEYAREAQADYHVASAVYFYHDAAGLFGAPDNPLAGLFGAPDDPHMLLA